MIKIFNSQLQLVAKLENTYNVAYEKRFNEVWTASFSLPADDPKNAECQPLNYVEIYDGTERVELFRITPSQTTRSDNGNFITYECEHVLSTLLDDVLFRYKQATNLSTRDTIDYLLGFQATPHWTVGTVDFSLFFSYKWENENVLSALFSLTQPFAEVAQWTFDTTVYPWRLNLVKPSSEPKSEIRYRKNLRGITRIDDPTPMVTRLYPLGYGDGDNQLDITSVNGGVPYIDADNSVALGGTQPIISDFYIDKRIEDPTLLLKSAQSILDQIKTPKVTYAVDSVDLFPIGLGEKFEVGDIVRVIDEELGINVDTTIMFVGKEDVTGAPGEIRLELGNKVETVSSILDLERRQRINELYAQGATNLTMHDFADNADETHPAKIKIFIPAEMERINKYVLTYQIEKFRAYERAIAGGGASTLTSASGGGVSTSTASGGGSAVTSAGGGDHYHVMFNPVSEVPGTTPKAQFRARAQSGTSVNVNLEAGFADIYTYGASGNHTHSITIPAHTHDFNVPNHSHSLTLPDHTHAIDYGIYELNRLPTAVTVKVDGNVIPGLELDEANVDIVPYLTKDIDGKVKRNEWHTIEIIPNDLGRVTANIVGQIFIQSRGEGNY